MVCTLLAGVNVVAFAADDLDDTISVQKFYFDATKGGNGEHIYTVDEDEISWYKSLPSWNDEGEAWKAPLFSEDPVYRVANYNTGEHLWITDKGYVDYLVGLGWTQEQGVAFYSDENMGVPVYRLWNGTDGVGSHHFTTNEEEIAWLVSTGWTNEGPQFYGVDKEEPQDLEILSAEQTGANTIEFTVSRALALTDEVDLLNGTTEQEMTYDVSEDGKTVEITTTAKLGDATYTIAVTPEDAVLPATEDVTCAAEKLAGLAFGPGLAFVSNQNFYTVATTLTGANQWGEPFNLASGTMKVYPGVASIDEGKTCEDAGCENVAPGFTTGYNATTKQYVLTKSDTIPFKVGDTVSLTAVYDSGDGTVIQQTSELPVLSVPQVSSMEFGDLATTSPKLMGQRVTVKNFNTDTYYFPVEAYDQYGNELDAKSLNYALKTSMLFVNPAAENSAFGGFAGEFDELEDGTVIMKLAHATKQIPGTGTVTVSAIGGLSTSASFTVEDNPYIASLTVVGLGDIIEGTPSTFGLVAIDQYGDMFDLYNTKIEQTSAKELTFTDSKNTLTNQLASLKVANGTLTYAKKSSTKQVGFIYTDVSGSKNDVLTLTTSVPSVNTMTLTIKEAGTPASIDKSLRTDVDTRLTRAKSEITVLGGADLDLTTHGLIFVDNNGLEMSQNLPEYTADVTTEDTDGYYYGIKHDAASGSTITVNPTTGYVTGIDQNTKFTVTLYQVKDDKVKTLDSKDFKVKFTSGKYDEFTAVWEDGDTFYVGDTGHVAADEDTLMVFGTDEYGVTALLVPNVDYLITCDDDDILSTTGAALTVEAVNPQDYVPTNPATRVQGTANFTVWGHEQGDAAWTEVAEAELEYDNMTPQALTWSWYHIENGIPTPSDESIDINKSGTSPVPYTQLDSTTLDPDGFIVTDFFGTTHIFSALSQYGLPLATGISYDVDGNKDVNIVNYTADKTNTIKANIKGLEEYTIYTVAR